MRRMTEEQWASALQFTLRITDLEEEESMPVQNASGRGNCSLALPVALALRGALLSSLLLPSTAGAASMPVVDMVLVASCYSFDARTGRGAGITFKEDSGINTVGNSFVSLDELIAGGKVAVDNKTTFLAAERRLLGGRAGGVRQQPWRRLDLQLQPLPPLFTNDSQQQLTFNILAPTSAAVHAMKAALNDFNACSSVLEGVEAGLAAPPVDWNCRLEVDLKTVHVVALVYRRTFWKLFWAEILANIVSVLVCSGTLGLFSMLLCIHRRIRKYRELRALGQRKGQLQAALKALRAAAKGKGVGDRWVRVRAELLRRLRREIFARAVAGVRKEAAYAAAVRVKEKAANALHRVRGLMPREVCGEGGGLTSTVAVAAAAAAPPLAALRSKLAGRKLGGLGRWRLGAAARKVVGENVDGRLTAERD